jgi:hypothetical protein
MRGLASEQQSPANAFLASSIFVQVLYDTIDRE